jgi:hypothetical protein
MNPNSYTTHHIFNKGTKNKQWRTTSSTNVAGKVVIYLHKTETRSMPVTLY